MENSPDELTLLDPDRSVPVTGVEHHQTALAVYTPDPESAGTEVEVELCFAPLTRGPQAGREGVEVRLDGWRVGELSARMSDRYGPVLTNVLDGGGRPGCLATISVAADGTLDMQAQLPEGAGAGAVVTRPAPTARSSARLRPALIGAGVVAVLLVVGMVLSNRAAELDAAGSGQPTVRAVPPTTAAPAIPATSSAASTSAAPTAPSRLGEAPAPAPAPRRSAPEGPASEAPPPPASPAPPAEATSVAPTSGASAPTTPRSGGGGLGGLLGGGSGSTPSTASGAPNP